MRGFIKCAKATAMTLVTMYGAFFVLHPIWQSVTALAVGVGLAVFMVWARQRLRRPAIER